MVTGKQKRGLNGPPRDKKRALTLALFSETLLSVTEPTDFPLDLDDPGELPAGPLELYEAQANSQSWVWFATKLAVARYQLSEAEHKLLLYVIALIHANHRAFYRYRVHVAAYAEACGISSNALYKQLRDAAESIQAKPLVITGHKSGKDGKIVDLLTSWFAEVEFGVGYIDFTFPPSLRRYLLGVKTGFLKFELTIPLHLSGEYAIRLYQFCKMWKFTGHSKRIKVSDLRITLGLIKLDNKGKIVGQRLAQYGDMKTWALTPALNELSRSSDILVRMKEIKKPGTKTVEAVEFTILDNPAYQRSSEASVPKLPTAKKAVVDPEIAKLIDDLKTEFHVTVPQARKAIAKHGVEYVKAKAAIVRGGTHPNAGASLNAAWKDDWPERKEIMKPPAKAKKATPTSAVDEPAMPCETPEEAEARFADNRRKMAMIKAKVGGPRKAEDQEQGILLLAPAAAEPVAAESDKELPSWRQ